MALNKGFISARIATDFQSKQVNGVTCLRFKICHNRRYKGEDHPNFYQCEAWDKGAELIEKHFRKGDAIDIEYSLRQDEWTDKEGNKRSTTVLRVEQFHFPQGRPRQDEDGEAEPASDVEATPSYGRTTTAAKRPAKTRAEDAEIPF